MTSRMTTDNGSHLDEEDESNLLPIHANDDPVARSVRRRVRGPTCMKKLHDITEPIKVQFNEYRQPIDPKTTSQLTHFMGSVARGGKYCPIYKPWPKVNATKKQRLLNHMKTKFDLPESSNDWILTSFGKKVRNWRARLKEYYDPDLPLHEEMKLKPTRVHKKHWKRLIKFWNKKSSMKLSEKNKENRAKKKMVQVTGKKSYARIREELKASSSGCEPSRMEMFRACFSKDGITKNQDAANAIEDMQEIMSQLPEGSIDKPGPEDTFSRVMGNDQNGLARMFGLGVRANDVWGVILSRSTIIRENIQLKSDKEQLIAKVVRYEAKESEREGSSEMVLVTQVGAEVYLRSIINLTKTVARGRIKSLDPNEEVGAEEIGPGWCEVNVQVAIKRCERLVRPHDLLITIEDAVGATTVWPCTLLSLVPLDDA